LNWTNRFGGRHKALVATDRLGYPYSLCTALIKRGRVCQLRSLTMTTLRLLSAAALLALATSASATSFVITTDWTVDALGSSSDATSSSTKDDKVILAARDDAASFVASQGAIRGVQLEAALQQIHQQSPELQATDAQLAQAILAY
jgi:uncharacterized protein (TIGR02448 family)